MLSGGGAGAGAFGAAGAGGGSGGAGAGAGPGKSASQAFVHPLPQVLKRMKTTIKRMEHMVDIYFMEESRRLRLSTSLGASGGSRSPVIG